MEWTAADRTRRRDRAMMHAALAAVLSRLAGAGAMVATMAIVARALSQAEFGVFAVLTALVVFLNLGDFGLGNVIMTRLPAALAARDHAAARTLTGLTLGTLTVVGALVAGLGAASTLVLPWEQVLGAASVPGHDVRWAVAAFFVCGGLSIPAGVGQRVLVALQRSSAVHTCNGLASLVTVGLVAGCAAGGLPLWALVAAASGPPALFALGQTAWVFRSSHPETSPEWSALRPRAGLRLLREASSYAVLNVAALVSYYIDALVVSAVLGAGQAAVFAVASRMFALVGGTLGLAGQQMWTALADALARGDVGWVRSRYWRSLAITTAVTGSACAVLVVFGRAIASLWVGVALSPPLALLVVIAIWTVYSTTMVQATTLLGAVGRVQLLAALAVVMAPANLVLSVVLTRSVGLAGPVLGSLVAHLAISAVPAVWLCRSLLRDLGASGESEDGLVATHPKAVVPQARTVA